MQSLGVNNSNINPGSGALGLYVALTISSATPLNLWSSGYLTNTSVTCTGTPSTLVLPQITTNYLPVSGTAANVGYWVRINNAATSTQSLVITDHAAGGVVTIAAGSTVELVATTGSAGGGTGTWLIMIQSPSPYYSLTPYIVGPGPHAQFTTISAAITQAVTDGHTNANPANIYIQPGPYTETVTLQSGINLIGFDNQPEYPWNSTIPVSNQANPRVKVTGTLIYNSAGMNTLSGIAFIQTGGGDSVTFNASGSQYPIFLGCTFTNTGGTMFNYVGNGVKAIFNGCYGSSTAALFASSVGDSVVIYATGCTFIGATASTIAQSSSTPQLYFEDCAISSQFTTTSGSGANNITCVFTNSVHNAATLWNIVAADVTANIAYNNCIIKGGGALTFGTQGQTATFTECTYVTAPVATGSYILEYNCTNTTTGAVVLKTVAGFSGGQYVTVQNALQTTSGTAQNLASIAVPAGTTCTATITVTAANNAHSDITGGTITVTADGTAAAIVGAPVGIVNGTSTGTLGVIFSGGNIVFQVTAPSATSYNWVGTAVYQLVLLST